MLKNIRKSIKLFYYNKRQGSRIKSLETSLKAHIGFGAHIGIRTFVDSCCSIGQHAYIGKNCNISKSSIGSYCSIANNVSIGQGEHALDKVSTSALFYPTSYEELTKEDCVIGSDVWIGTDVVILRGVHIGNGAVIGANAVVTKDVQDFEVVAGVPAKSIKFRFNEAKRTSILQSEWWTKDLDEAKKIISALDRETS